MCYEKFKQKLRFCSAFLQKFVYIKEMSLVGGVYDLNTVLYIKNV